MSFVIGLTGSIGMGKTETARLFATEGVPVFDADAAIHALYRPGGAAVAAVERLFAGTTDMGGVDRARLSAALAGDPARITALEAAVHPLVDQARQNFLKAHAGAAIVVLDIPLLLEKSIACDAVVVATAPDQIQRARVLARPGMTAEKLDLLLSRQMTDTDKRARAHFLVDTAQGIDHARAQVKMILAAIKDRIQKRPHA